MTYTIEKKELVESVVHFLNRGHEMKHEQLRHHYRVLRYLNSLPRKMLSLHGNDSVPEFVLHDLCHENCFNLSKAAYFVDNPDFDCLQGVAGFAQAEAYGDNDSMWKNPSAFIAHMNNAPFNNKVRSVARQSLHRHDQEIEAVAQELARDLVLEHPKFCVWDMKHHNHGLLIYEAAPDNEHAEELLHEGVGLLGFCPVY